MLFHSGGLNNCIPVCTLHCNTCFVLRRIEHRVVDLEVSDSVWQLREVDASLVDDALVLLLLDAILAWKHLVVLFAHAEIEPVSLLLVMPLDAFSLLFNHVR